MKVRKAHPQSRSQRCGWWTWLRGMKQWWGCGGVQNGWWRRIYQTWGTYISQHACNVYQVHLLHPTNLSILVITILIHSGPRPCEVNPHILHTLFPEVQNKPHKPTQYKYPYISITCQWRYWCRVTHACTCTYTQRPSNIHNFWERDFILRKWRIWLWRRLWYCKASSFSFCWFICNDRHVSHLVF